MRIAVPLLALALAACGSSPRPLAPWPPSPDPVAMTEPPESPTTGPHVVRRLLAEAHALVERDQTLARELPDPRGNARARAEADDLANELARIEAPHPTEDSATLDALVEGLARVTSRATLLNESLRIATSRITAVATGVSTD